VAITSVAVSRPTLDDVFLRYTGSTIRDAESSPIREPSAMQVFAKGGR
jgi:ABC-2 type transport system ATP-binding protein